MALTIPQGWRSDGGVGTFGGQSTDPYMQQVQSAYQGLQGATGQTPSSFSGQINRISPQDEESAYQTAYSGIANDQNFGMVDPTQVSAYYDLANPYMFGTGMEGINQQLAAAGFAPSGSGGIGPQAEMASRLQASLGVNQANALLGNAQQGASAQANAKLGIGQSRYSTLSKSNPINYSFGGQNGSQGGQSGGTQVKQSSPSFGSVSNPASSSAGNWWNTSYGQMNNGQGAAWNAQQADYYGTPMTDGARGAENPAAYGDYLNNVSKPYWQQQNQQTGYGGLSSGGE